MPMLSTFSAPMAAQTAPGKKKVPSLPGLPPLPGGATSQVAPPPPPTDSSGRQRPGPKGPTFQSQSGGAQQQQSFSPPSGGFGTASGFAAQGQQSIPTTPQQPGAAQTIPGMPPGFGGTPAPGGGTNPIGSGTKPSGPIGGGARPDGGFPKLPGEDQDPGGYAGYDAQSGQGQFGYDEVRDQWTDIMNQYNNSLGDTMKGIDADESRAARRAAEINANMGGSVGGNFAGGQIQAQLSGEVARAQARAEHNQRGLEMKMAFLEKMADIAKTEGNYELQRELQGMIGTTALDIASMENGTKMMIAGFELGPDGTWQKADDGGGDGGGTPSPGTNTPDDPVNKSNDAWDSGDWKSRAKDAANGDDQWVKNEEAAWKATLKGIAESMPVGPDGERIQLSPEQQKEAENIYYWYLAEHGKRLSTGEIMGALGIEGYNNNIDNLNERTNSVSLGAPKDPNQSGTRKGPDGKDYTYTPGIGWHETPPEQPQYEEQTGDDGRAYQYIPGMGWVPKDPRPPKQNTSKGGSSGGGGGVGITGIPFPF